MKRRIRTLLICVLSSAFAGQSALAHGDEDEHHGGVSTQSYTAPQAYPNAPSGVYNQLPSANFGRFGSYTGYWNQNQQQHEVLRRAGQQLDQLQAQGLISPQEHAMLETQMQLDHAAYDGQPLPQGFGYSSANPFVNPAVPGVLQRLAGTWGMGAANPSLGAPGQTGGLRHAMNDALAGNNYPHTHGSQPMATNFGGSTGQFGNYLNYWNQNPQEHQLLRRSEREAHELLEQGIITPQEHAMLDAQWQADHAAYDGRPLPRNLNYGFQTPYANPGVASVLQKLRTYWGR
ncbi:MAG: hypothetical protein K2X29_02110 [Candidatus Obscuribacterales bacterium]|nr:hypothetical protein [Candidatus Obscuribacterales bacterium]